MGSAPFDGSNSNRPSRVVERARRILAKRAEEERWWAEERERDLAETRFGGCTPEELIRIHETGRDRKGRPLRGADHLALANAWCDTFGFLPEEAADDDPDASSSQRDTIHPAGEDEGDDDSETSADLPAGALHDDTYLTRKQVAAMVNCSVRTIDRYVRETGPNRLPTHVQVGRRFVRFRYGDVREWIERNR